MDTNYLRDSLNALSAGFPQRRSPGAVETCRLCGALVNRSFQDAHNRGHG
jgi:hypothetical protein